MAQPSAPSYCTQGGSLLPEPVGSTTFPPPQVMVEEEVQEASTGATMGVSSIPSCL